jgi:hypothetical protein
MFCSRLDPRGGFAAKVKNHRTGWGSWDNGAMKHVTRGWKPLEVAALAVMLSGCASNHAATTSGPEQAKAEEAAIRRTIADLEQRINQGDLGFVDIFAKDAVIIVPGAPDVVGFNAIRTMYTDLMKQVSMTVHFSIVRSRLRVISRMNAAPIRSRSPTKPAAEWCRT